MYKISRITLLFSSALASQASSISGRDEEIHGRSGAGRICPDVDAGYDVNKVAQQAISLSSHSWEFGTLSEALLELNSSQYSVFSPNAFPNGKIPKPSRSIRSLAYAKQHIRTDNTTLIDGDGANGDPASLGVSAVLIGQSDKTYLAAAQRQEQHLFMAPRLPNGAISHRDTTAEAWADFIFMGPPFLAYWAVSSNNASLLAETVKQCGLYRQLLQNTTYGYWRHIDSNEGDADPGIWSTGNAWAAAGMSRVLATLVHWQQSAQFDSQKESLVSWIREIVDGARKAGREQSSGLLRNYLPDSTWFGETSGTALLAAVVYRMAVLAPDVFGKDYVAWADDSRAAIARHVGSDGILSPAVNPLGWGDRTPYTAGSPEGQSFGVFLYSAYRDYACYNPRH